MRASIALPGIFSPARIDGRWLVDGGLVNPVPVSACRALGADIVIAVDLNGDIMERRFKAEAAQTHGRPRDRPPAGVSAASARPNPRRYPKTSDGDCAPAIASAPDSPGYFDVLANSINIMQDHITRSRLAGEPPHIMLVPRLRNIGLLEFHRAAEAIAEGRACVEQALPALRKYI